MSWDKQDVKLLRTPWLYSMLLKCFTVIAVARSLLANNPGMRYFFSCIFIYLNNLKLMRLIF